MRGEPCSQWTLFNSNTSPLPEGRLDSTLKISNLSSGVVVVPVPVRSLLFRIMNCFSGGDRGNVIVWQFLEIFVVGG
jgi:hypothetical protein